MAANKDSEKTEIDQPTTTNHTNQAQLATALSGLHSQIRCQSASYGERIAARYSQLKPIREASSGISSAFAEIQKSFEKLGSTIVDTSEIEALKSILYPAASLHQRELQKIKGMCLGAGLGAVNQISKWLSSAVVKSSKLGGFSDTIAHIFGNSKQFQDQMASVFDIPKLDGVKTLMAGTIDDLKQLHITTGEQTSASEKQWKELFSPPPRIKIPDIMCNTGLGGFGIAEIHRQLAEVAKKIGMPPSMEDTSRKAHERGEINGAFFDAVMSEAGLAAEGESAVWHLIELLWSRIQSIVNGFTGWDSSREDYAQEARMKILSIAKRFREEISYINLVKAVTEYGQEELTNYLLKAVKNELIDVSRAARAKKHLILTESTRFESEDPRDIAVLDAVMIEKNSILNRILDKEQIGIFAGRHQQHFQAVKLMDEGYTQHEIAAIMGISQPRVCVLLSETPKKAKKISEWLYSEDRNSLYILEGNEL